MKRLLLCILFIIPLYAMAIDDVSMVSYDQPQGERAAISLKNNTNDTIRNVDFLLNYLDAKGNPFSYEEFSINIEIAPGKTKMTKIKGPGILDYYSIGSKGYHGDAKGYKVTYEFKGYNLKKSTTNKTSDYSGYFFDDRRNGGYSSLTSIIFLITYVALLALVGSMARKRNRSALLWIALSLGFTPFVIIIILAIIGKSE